MKVYTGTGLGDIYYQLIRDVTENGRKVTVRGQECLELPEPVALVYEQPGHCFMRIPGRKWNPFLALAEIVWILSGNGNVEWISYFGSNMRSFQDGTSPEFHGSYGLRMRRWNVYSEESGIKFPTSTVDQIESVTYKLLTDSTSRQAIISLWDPVRDNLIVSKDIPCNNWVGYTLRDGVLDQTVVIRSNDLVWGTPYNAVQFSHLQAYMAGRTGSKVGKLTYVINNLHYYLNLYKPTLTNIIDLAFEHTPLKAEQMEGFGPIEEQDFQSLCDDVDLSLRIWRDDLKTGACLVTIKDKYLNSIAQALWLFMVVKTSKNSKLVQHAAAVTQAIENLGQPLKDLIVDFYSDSTSEFVINVLNNLRGKDAVRV